MERTQGMSAEAHASLDAAAAQLEPNGELHTGPDHSVRIYHRYRPTTPTTHIRSCSGGDRTRAPQA